MEFDNSKECFGFMKGIKFRTFNKNLGLFKFYGGHASCLCKVEIGIY